MVKAKRIERAGTVRISVWAPVELWAQVEQAAYAQRMTPSDFVRRALAQASYVEGGQLVTSADVTIGNARPRLALSRQGGEE